MATIDYGDISQAKITVIDENGKKEVKKVSELTEEENKAFCYQLGAINSHLPIVHNM